MSLVLPSRVGNRSEASEDARENLNKLLHADSKEKVATRVALRHLAQIQSLQPGYFDGVKSWAKSGGVYLAAGAATIGALSLTACGLWQVVSKTNYGPTLVVGLCGAGWISSECGYRPIEYVKALLAAAVRDSANRAANASVKNDERVWKSNETKIKEYHDKIVEQLLLVYNDCAEELFQEYQQAENGGPVNQRLALKEMVSRLEKRLPTIERLLGEFRLQENEVEAILQRFKDRIEFVENRVCSLSSKTSGKSNAELIANWSQNAIDEIAVPFSIRSRAAEAHKGKFTFLDKSLGYTSALAAGVGTLALSTILMGIAAAAYSAYQNSDVAAPFYTAEQLFSYGRVPDHLAPKATLAALGILGLSTGVAAKKGLDYSDRVQSNAKSTEQELKACADELQLIYDGVATYLEGMPLGERAFMEKALRIRLPKIQDKITSLRVVQDSQEILGPFKRSLRT